jgi:hypothetical protein
MLLAAHLNASFAAFWFGRLSEVFRRFFYRTVPCREAGLGYLTFHSGLNRHLDVQACDFVARIDLRSRERSIVRSILHHNRI